MSNQKGTPVANVKINLYSKRLNLYAKPADGIKTESLGITSLHRITKIALQVKITP